MPPSLVPGPQIRGPRRHPLPSTSKQDSYPSPITTRPQPQPDADEKDKDHHDEEDKKDYCVPGDERIKEKGTGTDAEKEKGVEKGNGKGKGKEHGIKNPPSPLVAVHGIVVASATARGVACDYEGDYNLLNITPLDTGANTFRGIIVCFGTAGINLRGIVINAGTNSSDTTRTHVDASPITPIHTSNTQNSSDPTHATPRIVHPRHSPALTLSPQNKHANPYTHQTQNDVPTDIKPTPVQE
ncbi:hypothetical protein PTI98_005741 [Pleurotus ostreatus]|nr:hypothetical protein PTI98_005741 [Pleurotus ostreatus]